MTALFGALMMGLHLATGSLLLVMAVHAIIDLRGFVVLCRIFERKVRSAPDKTETAAPAAADA